jgi:plasmid maintenance system killer protein
LKTLYGTTIKSSKGHVTGKTKEILTSIHSMKINGKWFLVLSFEIYPTILQNWFDTIIFVGKSLSFECWLRFKKKAIYKVLLTSQTSSYCELQEKLTMKINLLYDLGDCEGPCDNTCIACHYGHAAPDNDSLVCIFSSINDQ